MPPGCLRGGTCEDSLQHPNLALSRGFVVSDKRTSRIPQPPEDLVNGLRVRTVVRYENYLVDAVKNETVCDIVEHPPVRLCRESNGATALVHATHVVGRVPERQQRRVQHVRALSGDLRDSDRDVAVTS